MEAFEVVGQADQIPFQAHFGVASEREAPKAHRFFDDSEDGLDGLLPQFVERAAGGGGGAVFHPRGEVGVGSGRLGLGALFQCSRRFKSELRRFKSGKLHFARNNH